MHGYCSASFPCSSTVQCQTHGRMLFTHSLGLPTSLEAIKTTHHTHGHRSTWWRHPSPITYNTMPTGQPNGDILHRSTWWRHPSLTLSFWVILCCIKLIIKASHYIWVSRKKASIFWECFIILKGCSSNFPQNVGNTWHNMVVRVYHTVPCICGGSYL